MSGYIGTQPVPQATQTRDSFTATSGQTSFATGGYTPNFLDVYLNGVKLASADYTASNGSDVVLASGAATGDILEVVAFTTFTPANIPSGTPSITDNGNATAITIDSSENVLVGKTALGVANAGFAVRNFGTGSGGGTTIELAKDDATAMYINRTSSDGEIIALRKDNTSVGSIATQGSRLSIGSGDVNLNFNASANSMYPISDPAAGTLSSGIVDLGAALATFKDAYLSGGVYLGGTGSANKLDDYEEGTWTPAQGTFGTWNSPVFVATYTKIGRQVTVLLRQDSGTVGWNSNNAIAGLPFTVSYQSIGYASDSGPSSDNGPILIWPSNLIYFKQANSSENALVLTATYFTND